jgi:hypothetical protein
MAGTIPPSVTCYCSVRNPVGRASRLWAPVQLETSYIHQVGSTARTIAPEGCCLDEDCRENSKSGAFFARMR